MMDILAGLSLIAPLLLAILALLCVVVSRVNWLERDPQLPQDAHVREWMRRYAA